MRRSLIGKEAKVMAKGQIIKGLVRHRKDFRFYCKHDEKPWGEQTKCPLTGQWISKMWYICNGVLFSLKEKGNSDTCYNMDEP